MANVDFENRAEEVTQAIRRLDHIETALKNYDDNLVTYILKYYNQDQIQTLGHKQRFDLAMRLLTKDLLFSNAYDVDGRPTEYMKELGKYYGNINLDDYEYIGIRSEDAVNYLARYCLGENELIYQPKVIFNYLKSFTENGEYPPILVTPCLIYINQEPDDKGVYVAYSDSFVLPYGGSDENITIYINKYHKIGARRKY